LESAISQKTSLIITNHASNVTGIIQPLREIGSIAKRYNLAYLVDCAQTAGKVDVDMPGNQIDLLAFAGHKGPFGPTGTGGLLISPKIQLNTLKEGGTGGKSQLEIQPLNLPEKFEAGTLNVVGIRGLKAGLEFIRETGISKIYGHEDRLIQKLTRGLREIPKVQIHGYPDNMNRVSVISFNIEGHLALVTNQVMAERYGIAARSGLHCAPLIHQEIRSFPAGAVRLSPGYFNTEEEVDYVLQSIAEIAETRFTAEEIQYIMECGAL
jgi:selenocysteine lyase/cysteine desulfurase